VKISIDLTNFSESIASILEQLSNVFSAQSRVSEEFVLKYLGFVTLEERDTVNRGGFAQGGVKLDRA
jgi:hypothetical protein